MTRNVQSNKNKHTQVLKTGSIQSNAYICLATTGYCQHMTGNCRLLPTSDWQLPAIAHFCLSIAYFCLTYALNCRLQPAIAAICLYILQIQLNFDFCFNLAHSTVGQNRPTVDITTEVSKIWLFGVLFGRLRGPNTYLTKIKVNQHLQVAQNDHV